MTIRTKLPFRWITCILAVLALLLFACHLTGDEKVEATISFNKIFDSLAQYDSVLIVLKDSTGRTVDIVYRGKVDTIQEIENLPAPHWDGGIVVVSITGYKGGEAVYAVNTKFNGTTSKKLDSVKVILPGTILSAEALEVSVMEGDSIPLPVISVTPVELSDKTLSWTSSAPLIAYVGAGYLKAVSRGTARLTVSLNSNPAKSLNLDVTVLADPSIPDSLILTPDTLFLAAGGAPGKLSIRFYPATADPGVTWILRHPELASLLGEGELQGLKPGETWVVAVSKRKPTLMDSCLVIVSAPVLVEKVQFHKDSVDLFLMGAPESLIVAVLPPKANPKVEFEVLDSGKVSLLNGKILGVSAGSTRVIARSVENPSKADTLKVTVFQSHSIDSVRVNRDTLKLYTGGESITLTGKVYPANVAQGLNWRSRDAAITSVDANGKTSPVSPGTAWVIAQSRVDSSKQDTVVVIVKKDAPKVFVGRDTVVSLGSTLTVRPLVIQEYGLETQFKWDLNGDGIWDGTSDSIKTLSYTFDQPKEYAVGFYVKDGEGNDTTVIRKVKAVNGPAVQILTPLNNAYTKEFSIAVSWTINGKVQDSLHLQTLKIGSNTISRSAKDEAGNLFSASVTVFVDTTPPLKPIVKGPARMASKAPTWTWSTGGGGGSGNYKYWLDVDDAALGKETRDTTFTPPTELSEALHTLFVSERDAAGNWSPAGRFALYVDISGPTAPKVSTALASPTNVRKPKWTWATGGNGGAGAYQYKLDNSSLNTGATQTTDTSFTPATNLAHGTHTLYVQEKDSAGNWSASGSASISIDTIAPDGPKVTSIVVSPTNNTQPTWNWASGGNGGKGFYRYKVGDTLWTSGGTQGTAITYTPTATLAEGARTLFVEEQDSAGNWSATGSLALTIDVTPPAAPKMDSTSYSPLNSLRPIWTWKAGGGGNGTYRCRVDNPDLGAGTVSVTQPTFPQATDLSEGKHVLYVQERDAAGNWSVSGSRTLVTSLREYVGAAGFSAASVSNPTLRLSNAGLPYVLFKDAANGDKATNAL